MRIIQKHESALDYDLQTRTGRTLGEYLDLGPAGRVALVHYLRHASPDTALAQEAGGMDAAEWSSVLKTNAILADLFDKLNEYEHNYIAANSRHKPKRPKPYPRPWVKGEAQKFGKDPVPIKEFWGWWKSKEQKDG